MERRSESEQDAGADRDENAEHEHGRVERQVERDRDVPRHRDIGREDRVEGEHGQPYTHGRFGLRQRAFDSTSRSVGYTSREGFTTDADGGFSAEIQSGLVSVFVTPDGSTARLGVPIVGIQELQVLPGQASAGVFHLVHVRMRVRFLEHDGTPATERYFSLDRYGNGRSDVRTNSEGWLVVDPAPTDPVRFHTWPKRMDQLGTMKLSQEERNQMWITVGPVQMPAGAVEAEFTLRLPDDGS